MKIIEINAPSRKYSAFVGVKIESLSQSISKISDRIRKCLVVSHDFLVSPIQESLKESFLKMGISVDFLTLPSGEQEKNLKTAEKIFEKALSIKLDRTSVIIAIGGGVVGDLCGFVASTFLRGIFLVHVPTTLLAMIDSSIGGKTGVDLAHAKNAVGTFYQPHQVWMDVHFLSTLPNSEFSNGLAEMIKYAVLGDMDLFEELENEEHLFDKNQVLENRIAKCVRMKGNIIEQDEQEKTGLRAILNLGHTLGHAIESVTHYQVYQHGQAVALGMKAAGKIAINLKTGWTMEDQERLERLIQKAELPLNLKSRLDESKILESLTHDKKILSGQLYFVLPEKIGKVQVIPIDLEEVMKGFRML